MIRRIAALLIATGCGSGPRSEPPGPATAPPAVTSAPRATGQAEPRSPWLWAWFADPSGLTVGSVVVVAGLRLGEIASIQPSGKGARIELALDPNLEIWSNARLVKRPTQLLGDYRLELDPGTPPADSESRFAPTRLSPGDEITDVVDEQTVDTLMDHIDTTLPRR
jgi:ABC-type transporter Mla subunit MlaD